MARSNSSYTLYDTPKKWRFIGAYKALNSLKSAALQEEIEERSARRIRDKWLETGSVSNLPRSGRPPKVTARMERLLVRNARKDRFASPKKLGNTVNPHIHPNTVCHYLDIHNLHRRVAQRVVHLKKAQRRKRNDWAKGMKGQNWWEAMWSDETYIFIGDRKGRVFVTRAPDEEFDEACLQEILQQSNVRVMVWACIMDGVKGPIVVLEYDGGKGGGFNAKKYREQVLQPVLLPFFRRMQRERPGLKFQQDGAPAHRAKTTKKWFDDHSIPLLPHPPSSPDVNPAEPVWHLLKDIIRNRPHPPTSIEELKTAVYEAWDSITVDKINKFVHSMPDRVQAIISSKGGHTRY